MLIVTIGREFYEPVVKPCIGIVRALEEYQIASGNIHWVVMFNKGKVFWFLLIVLYVLMTILRL